MARQRITCSFGEYIEFVKPAVNNVSRGWHDFENILNIDIEMTLGRSLGEKWRWLFQQLASPYGDIILKAHQAKYGVSDWQNNTQKGNSSL